MAKFDRFVITGPSGWIGRAAMAWLHRRFGADWRNRTALFGSRARGDHRADSDLDVIVDIDPELEKFSLIDLAGVCSAVEDLTGIETIAIERPMLERQPAFSERVIGDIVEVF